MTASINFHALLTLQILLGSVLASLPAAAKTITVSRGGTYATI